jgi:Fe-S oxidoreductase
VNLLEQAKSCTECQLCLEGCPVYQVTNEALFSPIERLKIAVNLCEGEEISEPMIESINNCLGCMRCEDVCPQEIKLTEVVFQARTELSKRGLGPPERQNRIIEGILATGNAVKGDPETRLEWLPEEFPRKQSDTLFYVGCLGSYQLKDAAASSYLVLKKLGFDFMLLEDEKCCGSILYENGRIDLAGELFHKNIEKFNSLGIKKIVVLCPICLKCFKYYYPKILGDTGISVQHVAQVIYDLLKQNPALLKKIPRVLTYHDPCPLARKEALIEEPRRILNWCGAELKEMEDSKENALCCGAGSGVRVIYRDLSLEIASRVLNMAQTETIVSACPLCTFHLNYASHERELAKKVVYFTNIVWDSVK